MTLRRWGHACHVTFLLTNDSLTRGGRECPVRNEICSRRDNDFCLFLGIVHVEAGENFELLQLSLTNNLLSLIFLKI